MSWSPHISPYPLSLRPFYLKVFFFFVFILDCLYYVLCTFTTCVCHVPQRLHAQRETQVPQICSEGVGYGFS